MDPVVAFYSGGRDAEGRTVEQILEWNDDLLEGVHDYIQWIFPTRQPSGVNPSAPLVTDETVRMFREDAALPDRLRRALDRMLAFYGLRRTNTRIEIDASRFLSRARVWVRPGNHNHLRLTRIMESLATLGLKNDAQALQRCLLEDVCCAPGGDAITQRTREFWRTALRT